MKKLTFEMFIITYIALFIVSSKLQPQTQPID